MPIHTHTKLNKHLLKFKKKIIAQNENQFVLKCINCSKKKKKKQK